jgi:hypothetical protein
MSDSVPLLVPALTALPRASLADINLIIEK